MTSSNHTDVLIIGAGAAGLMCALHAGRRGRRVVLVDHAEKAGEKIRISGGGRCNFTNLYASPAQYLSQNPHFCISALKRYTQHDFIAMVQTHGIAYHEKTLGQLFCDGSSKQIIHMLLQECADAQVQIELALAVQGIEKNEQGFLVHTPKGDWQAESLVVASGGLSIPKMGATGFGYQVAKQFGIPCVATSAGLVPFTLPEPVLKAQLSLAGVSLEVEAHVGDVSFREGMLFTHRGLSGPAILQISSYWREGQAVRLNLLPGRDVAGELQQARLRQPKQELRTWLAHQLPRRLVDLLTEQQDWQGRLADAPNTRLQQLASHLEQWIMQPNGTEGYRTAEVTLGGVDTDALSSRTMEAKAVKGLYFIGEVVDVTGWLGGYNFQWAWSSGYAAGQAV